MRKLLYIISCSTFFLGCLFIYKGFDKKNNYREPKYSSNAYVGGDAYNYIINSNYFTGYNVLGMGCYMVTVLSFIGAEILKSLEEKQKQASQFYEFIYHHPMFSSSGNENKNALNQKSNGFSVNDWGQLPDFLYKSDDQNQSAQEPDLSASGSSQTHANNNNPNNYQSQHFQNYSNSQHIPNEKWGQPYSQNPTGTQPAPYNNYGQNFGIVQMPNSQNNSSLQVNSKNM